MSNPYGSLCFYIFWEMGKQTNWQNKKEEKHDVEEKLG